MINFHHYGYEDTDYELVEKCRKNPEWAALMLRRLNSENRTLRILANEKQTFTWAVVAEQFVNLLRDLLTDLKENRNHEQTNHS